MQTAFTKAQYLVMQFEIPAATIAYAIKTARKNAVKIILNPAPAYPEAIDLLKHIDYLILNETEASILSGIRITNEPTSMRACSELLSLGAPVVVLTLGDQGALLATNNHIKHYPAHKVNVVDTTAAGDAFIGAFTLALSKEFPLEKAIEFSNCAGALAVSKLGAQPSLPTFEELHAFCEQAISKALDQESL
jgi:ribokinase